jgi:putative membrane protein
LGGLNVVADLWHRAAAQRWAGRGYGHRVNPGRARYSCGMKVLMRWFLLACALVLVTQLGVGVRVEGLGAALWAALILGLLNAFLRPLLIVLTLPVTVLSLGLFLFVINAAMFGLTARMLSGFSVDGFWSALLGSVLYSLCAIVIDAAIERWFPAAVPRR